jgi:hypothetical protein
MVGMALFDPGERRKTLGRGLEYRSEGTRVITALSDLIVELRDRLTVTFFDREMPETRIHLGVFMGLAFNRDLECSRRRQRCSRIEQIEMPERMLNLLFGRGFKNGRGCLVSGLSGQFREVALLDVGHRLAGERRLEVPDRDAARRA